MTANLCTPADDALFFPRSGKSSAPARAICAACPVREDCLRLALKVEAGQGAASRHGIYGGLTPGQRAKIDRNRRTRR